MVEYEKYNKYNIELRFLNELKQTSFEDIQQLEDLINDLDTEAEPSIKEDLAKIDSYESAVDFYEEYSYIFEDASIEDDIEKVEKQENILNIIINKIDVINNIVTDIKSNFTLLNIEVSHGSLSTYLKIEKSDINDFKKTYPENIDFDFSEDYEEIATIRISDHAVGGNEFTNYPHSQFEFII